MLNSLGLFTTALGVQHSLRIKISASNSITKTQIHNRHNQRPPMTQGLRDPLQSPPWRTCKEKKGEGIKPDSEIVEYCVRGLGLGNGDFGWGKSERERKTTKWRKPCVNL